MDRWANKVAVVTGASSGIGAAVAKDLVKAGLIVVGLARREERLREDRLKLPPNLQSNYHTIKCDVSKEEDVKSAFAWVEKNLGGTDVLVNNAGIGGTAAILAADNGPAIRQVVDTNVMAVVFCVREAFNSMKNRNIDGHVVIVNSIAGHKVPIIPGGGTMSIYPATKYAVTALTETYRQEFANAGTKVKVTSISPGAVDTEILPEAMKNGSLPLLNAEDISNAILYVIGTPPNVQIHELMIKPIGESF